MKFDHLSKETSHYIKTDIEEEQKALLDANDKLVEQQLLFEEDNNDLIFFLGSDDNIISLNISGITVATKRSTLGLYKDSFLAKQFDDPLWVQKKYSISGGVELQGSCQVGGNCQGFSR